MLRGTCFFASVMSSAVVLPSAEIMSAAGSPEENSGPEEEQRGTKRKISLSSCGVCATGEAKYRCPACLSYSCSLLCVKKHKEDSGCSGVRNKTTFVTLSHFDEMALLSDYRFLEDTGRFADGATRDRLLQTPRSTIKAKKLAANARKKNITLRFLPVTFTRSRENSTFYLSKERLFLWHVKLLFPQSSTEFTQRRVSEQQTLEQILTLYVHPTESDPVIRQKLKMYVQAPFDDVKVFMKAEGRKANSVRYHELDIHKSLRDNLSYKTLIEYPVLHVVLRDHWKDYPPKGPAEPAQACISVASRRKEPGQETDDVTPVSPSIPGTEETSPEAEPQRVKRAKRDTEEEEMEEGEIVDSSEEEEDAAEESSARVKSHDEAESPANDMKVLEDQPADAVDTNVDDSVNKHTDSSTDLCSRIESSFLTDDKSAVREIAEVSVTQENAVTEPEPVHTHHCQDGSESAHPADSCGSE